ncbi:MAG TPA: class I SAM-dependent methyltransferase [Saprospiraceae bacterium]|nr:class I SAM-dependent methyltransferase [Saprospiraceae bacterium]
MNCRFCKQELKYDLVDLFHSPASNSFLSPRELNEPEVFFPLRIKICDHCFLVQIDEYKKSDAIFNDQYVYFSSYSTSWLAHSKAYVEMMISRFGFDSNHLIMELASNDGYLLQYFKEKNIPVLGIEPTANTAEVAINKGIPTIVRFFGRELALELKTQSHKADLIVGNNVLAHVPDIVDFVSGMKIILSENGVITMEFPHLMNLIDQNQFDTIYHEHYSYLSLYTVAQIFRAQDLRVFDVEQIHTHGGSLRIFACHEDCKQHSTQERVSVLLHIELEKGMNQLQYYSHFTERCLQVKVDLMQFLLDQKKQGKTVAAYGAAAKGNTLLNYCGIKNDLISYVIDLNPSKQNKYLPGSYIPVFDETYLISHKPDVLIILPWNIKDEIILQLNYAKEWGCKFYIAIPSLQQVA